MTNYIIKLPTMYHSEKGAQKTVHFSMSKKNYYINGERFPNPLKFAKEDLYYKYSILKHTVLVTVFQKDSILP